MTVTAFLASGFANNASKIGDFTKIVVSIDEQIGAPGDEWKISSANSKWVISGNLVLDASSVKAVPADGSFTRLEIEGLIHSAGDAVIGPISFVHIPSSKEISLSETSLADLKVAAPQQQQKEPHWYLPPVAFGGWNIFLVTLCGFVLLAAITFAIYQIMIRLRGSFTLKLNHKERALRTLEQLQAYGKPGRTLGQEDWKKFSFELAGVLRKYTDANFEFNSSDMTDREFLYELSRKENAKTHVEILRSTLSTIDEVRYGKKALETALVPGLIVDSKRYIESSFIDRGKKEVVK